MKEEYYNIIKKLAQKAAKHNEIPVGAIIVKNNKIIAKGYNRRNKSKFICDHAELIAIKKASKKLKDWRLDECDIYITLKPCKMCESAINQSRIKNVFFVLEKDKNKKEYYKTKYVKKNNSTQKRECTKLLKTFFEKKRDKN